MTVVPRQTRITVAYTDAGPVSVSVFENNDVIVRCGDDRLKRRVRSLNGLQFAMDAGREFDLDVHTVGHIEKVVRSELGE